MPLFGPLPHDVRLRHVATRTPKRVSLCLLVSFLAVTSLATEPEESQLANLEAERARLVAAIDALTKGIEADTDQLNRASENYEHRISSRGPEPPLSDDGKGASAYIKWWQPQVDAMRTLNSAWLAYVNNVDRRLSEVQELTSHLQRFRSINQGITANMRSLIGISEEMTVVLDAAAGGNCDTPRLRRLKSAVARLPAVERENEAHAQQLLVTILEAKESLEKKSASLAIELLRARREAVGDLVNIFNAAAERSWMKRENPGQPLPKGGRHEEMSLNCSQHFREFFRELGQRGMRVSQSWTDSNCDANCIIARIKGSRAWKRVQESEVQGLANRNNVVVGVAPGPKYGHIAIAFPIPPDVDPTRFSGEGPFIRDGNERMRDGRLFASSWGAVKASIPYWQGEPEWYAYVPLLLD